MKLTRERVRIGRALRELPAIEQAFVGGAVSYSRVREVTRVATPEDEQTWLELATTLSMRALEQRVAAVGGAEVATGDPAQVRWRSPEVVELSLKLPAATWALLQRAMQGARLAAEGGMNDAEALEAVAREALARQQDEQSGADGDASCAADPRRAVVLYRYVRGTETPGTTNVTV